MNKTTLLSSLLLSSCIPGFCQKAAPVSEKPDGRVNYPSNFQVEGGANLFVFGDYLYWIAHEDGLYYAQTGAGSGTSVVPPSSIDFDGELKKIDPHCESGLRGGAGLNFPKEGYDFKLYWTWFSTDAEDSVHSSEGDILPLWAQPDFTHVVVADPTFAFSAKGRWDLDYNVGDVEWGRSAWFGGYFSLRPFFGIRGLWIDQDLDIHYTYNTSPIAVGKWHIDSDFRGAGLRAGADARFSIPWNFSIYGLASGSLLYGRFNADAHFEEDSSTIARSKDHHFWKGVSSLQIGAGLAWDTHFFKDHCHIEFHVGWEQNIWFNVNQMSHFMNTLRSGSYFKENSNLTLQGLVAGGRFDF